MKFQKKLLWKIPLIIFLTVVTLIFIALIFASIYLTPERLTKWTEEYGTEYLHDGQVKVERVELTIWKTFPRVMLEVDGLEVINNHPEVPDSLRRVIGIEKLSGKVNILSLLTGQIYVNHVEITRPEVNFWVGDTINSLCILPPSEPDTVKSEVSVPNIKLSRFEIFDGANFRYVVPADSTDMALSLTQTALKGNDDMPQYHMAMTGRVSGLLQHISEPLTLGMNGDILWSPQAPLQVQLNDFAIDFDEVSTLTSLTVDMANRLEISRLDFALNPVRLSRLSGLGNLMPIMGDAAIAVKANLLSPYTVGDTLKPLPHLHAEIFIDDAPLEVPAAYLSLSNVALALEADVRSESLDSAVVTLRRLNTRFPATDFTLEASASNLASDPHLSGCLKGDINFTNLNPRIWTLLGMRLGGSAEADFDFDLHLSDLTPNTFHRANLTGDLTLRNFRALLPADSIAAGARCATFRFGTDEEIVRNNFRADSMLTASLSIDTAWVTLPELTAELGNLHMGMGIENRANTADTTTVTPMGGRLTLGTLRYRSADDSTRAVIRDLSGGIALTRFKGQNRAPQLNGLIKARRIMYTAGDVRLALRSAEIDVTGHFAQQSKKSASQQRPRTPRDSARIAARRDSMLLANAGHENIDFGANRSMVTLLRKWNITGNIRAEKGRMVTPAFPLRTTMENLEFGFNADSLMLKSLMLNVGHSDFSLRGLVSNMQKAMGRRSGQPLKVRLELISDTLNVNELVYAMTHSASATLSDNDDDADFDFEADTTVTLAPVMPMNIDGLFYFKANNVVYSTMLLHDFSGEVLVANGAANLRDLEARSPVGSIALNMLYSAPTRSDVNFGVGLDLRRIDIAHVGKVVPALDSIMPILNTLGGYVDVDISATTPVDSMLNLDMYRLQALVRMRGDSLRVLDDKTFRTVSKWLLFRNKKRNLIDHAEVQVALEEGQMKLYPFMFDFDRYRIGVMGHNDLDLNLNYHVSILKSPIPFRFGINIKGSSKKMKIRLGRARFKENMAAETLAMSDTVRMNLANEIRRVFAQGVRNARISPLRITAPENLPEINEEADTLTAADSLFFRQEGLIDSIPPLNIPNEQ